MNTTIFKRLLLSSAAGMIICSSALADDLTKIKTASQIINGAEDLPHNWQGYYVGGFIGINNFEDTVTMQNEPAWAQYYGPYDGEFRPGDRLTGGNSSYTAGVEFGYNQQFGRWVAGVEADYMFGEISGTAQSSRPVCDNCNGGARIVPGLHAIATGQLNDFGTARARIGYTFNNLLVFATGGLAWGQVNTTLTDQYLYWDGDVDFPYAHSGNRVGWTLGAGTEYAVSEHVSLKLESLYYDLGSYTGNYRSDYLNPSFSPSDMNPYAQYKDHAAGEIVRAGLNYKF